MIPLPASRVVKGGQGHPAQPPGLGPQVSSIPLTFSCSMCQQKDAESWVKALWAEGDAVLFENNLPDLFEQRVAF